tara:strand:+ start:2042 stop:4429 length:2388 start_codon:yes stop_codon:yes gene_type:complete
MNSKKSLIDVVDDSLGIDKDQLFQASEEIKKIKDSFSYLQPATENEINEIRKEIETDKKELNIFRLFGTSGIRGILKNIYSDVVREYADNTFMSPKLAYYYGRAYGWLISKLKMEKNVRINMDPRPSSFCMATVVCEGLLEEGVDANFNGVASTPMGSLYENSIIITASHNEIKYNGIKAFIHGIPISFDMEWIIESGFRLLDCLEKRGKTVSLNNKRGNVYNTAAETSAKYLQLGRKIIVQEKLGEYDNKAKIIKNKLKSTVMPLDLAFGASGANVLNNSPQKSISPQLKLLLETGTIIIGYGTEREGNRTNYRIGAAYPYGETPDVIGEGELEAFAGGEYGYGDNKKGGHISRSFYFPADYVFKEPSLKKEAIELDDAYVFIDLDNHLKKNLLSKLRAEIKGYELLPACSVDCDEDRFLATSPSLSKQPIPYLSGDLMIMLFAANCREDIKKVVFTVESGLSIGKYLEKKGIEYKEVTVGDRAIADYIMDEERLKRVKPEEKHKIIGGEPSGHMMFGVTEKGNMDLIDDPIITQLKILGLMRKTGKNFDTLLKKISDEVEEVFTARKPESWAGEPDSKGISLREKINLELRERGSEKVILTEYAKKFISEYINIFSEGYVEAYYKNIPENLNKYADFQKSIRFSDELKLPAAELRGIRSLNTFNKLLKDGKTSDSLIKYLNVGKIDIKTEKGKLIEEIEIKLRLTTEDWAGPADINLSFYSKDQEGNLCLAGGVVTRNSGTSPKNSAYNKLWFEHYPTGHKVGNEVIERVTTKMAKKRVEFTNQFIKILRTKT